MCEILFLLKKNNEYGYKIGVRSGLYNSVKMLVKELEEHYHKDIDMEICIDANSIDKYLHKHKPSIAIIEALWVTPAKLKELIRLHKKVHFIIRLHSEVPFLANEGVAVEWIKEYDDMQRTYIAFNSKEAQRDFGHILQYQPLYLPNVYDHSSIRIMDKPKRVGSTLDIGCFGAIRPMKNHLLQAMVAIRFADSVGKHLHFHINGTRIEQKGDSVLKNLRALFKGTGHHLVEHKWLDREQFLHVVDGMDFGMQFSFSESFNIVTADFISQGVPVVVSQAIEWMPPSLRADSFDADCLLKALKKAYFYPNTSRKRQTKALLSYNKAALREWGYYI